MFIRHRQGLGRSGRIAGFCAPGRVKNSPQRARGYAGNVKVPTLSHKTRQEWGTLEDDFVIGGSGPTREEDAGRSTGTFDALLRWTLLRSEVSEQSAASAGAGERDVGDSIGGAVRVASSSDRGGTSRSVAGRSHAGIEYSTGAQYDSLPGGIGIRIEVCGESAGRAGVRLSAYGDVGSSAELGGVCWDACSG
jgi:hypothetical protein